MVTDFSRQEIADKKVVTAAPVAGVALDRAKIAVKHLFGYGLNESGAVDSELQGIVDWCVQVAEERVSDATGPTLKEFLTRMDKVGRSIRRHASDGRRSYYLFVRDTL